MQNFGRLRLVPLALYAGAETAPLRVSWFVCRRGGVTPPATKSQTASSFCHRQKFSCEAI